MSETKGRRPAGYVGNPAAIAEARKRGWPVTNETISDAATLAGIPPYIPASQANVAAGLAELDAAGRVDDQRRQEARDMERVKSTMEKRT